MTLWVARLAFVLVLWAGIMVWWARTPGVLWAILAAQAAAVLALALAAAP